MAKVLIVDDAAFMRMMLKNILTQNDFEVSGEAETGVQGVEMYRELRPDIITMDITMPGMDGITAIRKILEIDAGANIIVCSALGQKEVVMEAIQAGAKHFIIKPFDNDKVRSTVKAVLGI